VTNARTSTAKRGFGIWLEVYGQTGEFPDLHEVNRRLRIERREPIHARSITHYRNMWAAGFRRVDDYMPINRFDIMFSVGTYG
jgi:hypothetical protein